MSELPSQLAETLVLGPQEHLVSFWLVLPECLWLEKEVGHICPKSHFPNALISFCTAIKWHCFEQQIFPWGINKWGAWHWPGFGHDETKHVSVCSWDVLQHPKLLLAASHLPKSASLCCSWLLPACIPSTPLVIAFTVRTLALAAVWDSLSFVLQPMQCAGMEPRH